MLCQLKGHKISECDFHYNPQLEYSIQISDKRLRENQVVFLWRNGAHHYYHEREEGRSFSRKSASLDVEGSDWVFFAPHAVMICHSLSNFIGYGNPLTFSYSESSSKIGKSERMYCSLYDCLQIAPGIVLVPVCVCEPIFSFCSKMRGHDKCSMPSRV